MHGHALLHAKRSNEGSVWHQGFVDRNKPVTRHLSVLGFHGREHYVKRRQGGIERCEQVRLVGLVCVAWKNKTAKKKHTRSVNSRHHNAFGLSVGRVWQVRVAISEKKICTEASARPAALTSAIVMLRERTGLCEQTGTSEDAENGRGVPALRWLHSTDALWPRAISLPAGVVARASALNCSHSSSAYFLSG